MSEGSDAYALYDLTAATVMELWMEYEVCNNRWH